MGIKVKASSGGGDYRVCPAGTHPAVLVAVLDIGTHTETYNGESKDTRKVVLIWDVHPEEEEPIVVLRDFTLSFNEKATLRQLVERWRGTAFQEDEEFDVGTLAGKSCYVQIVHKQSAKDRTYARVDGLVKLPKGAPTPKSVHPPLVWSVEDRTPFPTLPYEAYLRGKPVADVVKECHELKHGRVASGAHVNDTAAQAEEAF